MKMNNNKKYLSEFLVVKLCRSATPDVIQLIYFCDPYSQEMIAKCCEPSLFLSDVV